MNALPQLVDPFIPQRPRPTPAGQYGTQWLRQPSAPATQPVRKTSPSHKLHRIKSINDVAQKTRPAGTTRPAISDVIPVKPAPPMQTTMTSTNAIPQATHVNEYRHIQNAQTKTSPVPTKKGQGRQSLLIHILRKSQIPLIVILAIIGGQLMTTLVFGEIAIGAYALFAIIRHVASSITFLLAFITLIAIAVLEAAGKNGTLATYFAIYAFLLLVVGTISLGTEIRGRY